jgi:hypothetical protein
MKKIISGIINIKDFEVELVPFLEDIFEFPPNITIEKLKQYLSVLKDDLWIFVEYPYVDKVFRDSYYTYFSTKRREQVRDCVRLSFFDRKVSNEHFRDPSLHKDIQEGFLGFMLIRPTLPYIFGRSLLSPRALKSKDFSCCLVNTEVLINGRKLSVQAFPYSAQDTETISCAETTIWSIMEYFGNKYPEYRPVLPSTIVNALSEYSCERQIPSHGLSADEISYALKRFGFGVRIYAREAHKEDLRRIFHYYIESGIPFIAALENAQRGHAVVVIGHENRVTNDIVKILPESLISSSGRQLSIIDLADLPLKYVVIDDNLPPYRLGDFESPMGYYSDPKLNDYKVHSIIVPLYQKIYLEAFQARRLVFAILKNDIMSGDIKGDVVFRLQLTSSRSFKHGIAVNGSIDRDVRDRILATIMAKFIWVAELSDRILFPGNKGFGLIILDATEANENSFDALIFMAYSNKFITLEKRRPQAEKIQFLEFELYNNNLIGGF